MNYEHEDSRETTHAVYDGLEDHDSSLRLSGLIFAESARMKTRLDEERKG